MTLIASSIVRGQVNEIYPGKRPVSRLIITIKSSDWEFSLQALKHLHNFVLKIEKLGPCPLSQISHDRIIRISTDHYHRS